MANKIITLDQAAKDMLELILRGAEGLSETERTSYFKSVSLWFAGLFYGR